MVNRLEEQMQTGEAQVYMDVKKQRKICLLFICLGLLVFFIDLNFVREAMEDARLPYIDVTVRNFILGLRGSVLTVVIKTINFLAETKTIVAFCLCLLMGYQRISLGFPATLSVSAAALLNYGIKHLVLRPRPDAAEFLLQIGGYSFPSGHSCSSVAFYGMLAYILMRKYFTKKEGRGTLVLGCVLACLPEVIAFGRVYLGVHYPTDVIAGLSLGLVMLMLAIMVYETVIEKDK